MIIDDKDLRKSIMLALSDEHMSKILESTSVTHRTANEIMKEHDLPHSTAYRKIKALLKFGLLVHYKSEINDGKKIAFYKSIFRSIQINYEGSSQYRIETISNPDALERLSVRFYDLDSGH